MNRREDDLPQLLAHADGLLRQGRLREAVHAYRALLELQPDVANAWFNLGYALRQLGEFEPALHAYGEALIHGISRAEEVHLNRAAIHADHLRRDDQAEAELRAALAIAPHYAPALLNLGNLHEERGHRESAIECYRRILETCPQPAGGTGREALARLAQLQPPVNTDDPMLSRLQQAAASLDPLDDGLRANLYFALGRALDALGEPARAFAAFDAGKRTAHRRYPPYDPARAEQHTRALIQAFPAPASVPTGALDASPQPLFICGMFRSGSTLLEQVLAAHPDVTAAGELDLLPRMIRRELDPFPASAVGLDDAAVARLARQYHGGLRERLPESGAGRRYATDKRPDNYLLIGLIKRLFPRAKILHTRRNPLDNGLSVFMQHLNPRMFDYAGTLAGIGHHHGQQLRLMTHWKSLYPNEIHDFDYDAFVVSPEATLRPLLEFIGLTWHDDCLQFHRLGNTVKTASYWQVRRPLYGEASGRWRRYAEFLGPLRESLAAAGIETPD